MRFRGIFTLLVLCWLCSSFAAAATFVKSPPLLRSIASGSLQTIEIKTNATIAGDSVFFAVAGAVAPFDGSVEATTCTEDMPSVDSFQCSVTIPAQTWAPDSPKFLFARTSAQSEFIAVAVIDERRFGNDESLVLYSYHSDLTPHTVTFQSAASSVSLDCTIGAATTLTSPGPFATVDSVVPSHFYVCVVSGGGPIAYPLSGSWTADVTAVHADSNYANFPVGTIYPVITPQTPDVMAEATSFVIDGFALGGGTFTFVLSKGAVCSNVVGVAPGTSLTCTMTTKPTSTGTMTASVSVDGLVSATASVAKIYPSVASILPDTFTPCPSGASGTFSIAGNALGTSIAAVTIALNDSTSDVSCTYSDISPTSLTCTYPKPTMAGRVYLSSITVDGVTRSYPNGVLLHSISPVVTAGSSVFEANNIPASVSVSGSCLFGTTSVTLTNSYICSITATASNSVTCNLTPPATPVVTSVKVTVTGASTASTSAVDLFSVGPVITETSSAISADTTTLSFDVVGYADGASPTVKLNGDFSGTTCTSTTVSAGKVTCSLSSWLLASGTLQVTIGTSPLTYTKQIRTVSPVVELMPIPTWEHSQSVPTSYTVSGAGFGPSITANPSFGGCTPSAILVISGKQQFTCNSVNIQAVGSLLFTVSAASKTSVSVTIANVIPFVSSSSPPTVDANVASITVSGYGFSSLPAAVALSSGVCNPTPGSLSAGAVASLRTFTCTFTTLPASSGALHVTSLVVDGASPILPKQVATVRPVLYTQTLTSVTCCSAFNSFSFTLTGQGLSGSPTLGPLMIGGATIPLTCSVTANDATSMTCLLNNPTGPIPAGTVTAKVSNSGQTSTTAVSVFNILPSIVTNTNPLSASSTAVTFTVNGASLGASSTVTLSPDGTCNSPVTFSATGSADVTCTFAKRPPFAGNLAAKVSVGGLDAAAQQIATVVPWLNNTFGANQKLLFSATAQYSINVQGYGLCHGTGTCNAPTFAITPDGPSCASPSINTGATGLVTIGCTVNTNPNFITLYSATVTANLQQSPSAALFSVVPTSGTITTNGGTVAANIASFDISGSFGDRERITSASITTDSGFACSSDLGDLFNGATTGSMSSIKCLVQSFATKSGPFTATITINGASVTASGSVMPVLTATGLSVPHNAIFPRTFTGFGLNGAGFSINGMGSGFSCSVGTRTATSVQCTGGSPPFRPGPLSVTVTAGGVTNPAPVTLLTVTPVVTNNAVAFPADSTSFTVTGFGLVSGITAKLAMPSIAEFGSVDCAVGSINAANTSFVCTVPAGTFTYSGVLAVVVVLSPVDSGYVNVATITPVITAGAIGIPVNPDITSFLVKGAGLRNVDTATLVVTSGNIAQAAATASAATGTQFTCSLASPITTSGNVRVSITFPSQLAVVGIVFKSLPVVTENTSPLQANASSFVIDGFGLTPLFTFSGGVASCESATSVNPWTKFTCTFTGSRISTSGPLMLTATGLEGTSSGAPVQVANVIPVITSITNNDIDVFGATGTTPPFVTVAGYGLGTTFSATTVNIPNAACAPATATPATTTSPQSLACNWQTYPTVTGTFDVKVTSNSVQSTTSVTITVRPVIQTVTLNLDASSDSVNVTGWGFTGPTGATVVLNNGQASPKANGACDVGPIAGNSGSNTFGWFLCTFTERPRYSGVLRAGFTGPNGIASRTSTATIATVIPVLYAPITPSVNYISSIFPFTIEGYGMRGYGATTPTSVALYLVADASPISCGTVSVVEVGGLQPQQITCTPSSAFYSSGTVRAAVTTKASSTYISPTINVLRLIPVITSSTAEIGRSSQVIAINGNGFRLHLGSAGIEFNLDAVCASSPSINAAGTKITCTMSSYPTSTGPLNVKLSLNGVDSVTTQIGVVVPDPVVTTYGSSPPNHAKNAASLVIAGSNFGTSSAAISVVFTPSTFTCPTFTVQDDQITCDVKPDVGTSDLVLLVVVTRSGGRSGSPPGTPVLIRNLVQPPTITSSVAGILEGDPIVSFAGINFGTVKADMDIKLRDAALTIITCSSFDLTDTLITCQMTSNPVLGALTATVVRAGGSSASWVNIRTVALPPTLDIPPLPLPTLSINPISMSLTGTNFYATAKELNVVILSSGQCVPTAVTTTKIDCTVRGTPLPTGTLSVVSVISNGLTSTNPSAVALYNVKEVPVVFPATRGILVNTKPAELVITGSGFAPIFSDNEVTLTCASGACPVCTITAGSRTSLTCSLSANFVGLGAVSASASIPASALDSGAPTQIAEVRDRPYFDVLSPPDVLAVGSTTIALSGNYFSPTASDNVVTLSSGGSCTVVEAAAMLITCQLSGALALGPLNASVVVDGISASQASYVVALVVPQPQIFRNVVSSGSTAATHPFIGTGFNTETPTYNKLGFSDGLACDVVVAGLSASSFSCSWTTAPVANQPIYVTNVTVYYGGTGARNSVTANYALPGVYTGERRVKPVITSASQDHTGPAPLVAIAIEGTDFSSVASEMKVTLSQGTCTIASSPAPNTTSFTCLLDPTQFPAGPVSATVQILNGVSSDSVQVFTLSPLLPEFGSEDYRAIPIDTFELFIASYYMTNDVSKVVSVELDRGAVCNITGASYSSVTCLLYDGYVSLGDVEATITLDAPAPVGQKVTGPKKIGTVVPNLYDTADIINVDDLLARKRAAFQRTLVAAGLFASPIITLDPFDTNLECKVVSHTLNEAVCELTVADPSEPVIAGYLYAAVTVKESGIDYTSPLAILATIQPVVRSSTTELDGTAQDLEITIAGLGFSPFASENTIRLVPSGSCDIVSASSTELVCAIEDGSLAAGPLAAIVETRGVDSGAAVQVADVAIAAPDGPPQLPPEAAPSDAAEPQLPPSEGEGVLSAGAAAGIAIGVVLFVIILALAIFLVLGYRKYGSVGAAVRAPFTSTEFVARTSTRADGGGRKPGERWKPRDTRSRSSKPAASTQIKKAERQPLTADNPLDAPVQANDRFDVDDIFADANAPEPIDVFSQPNDDFKVESLRHGAVEELFANAGPVDQTADVDKRPDESEEYEEEEDEEEDGEDENEEEDEEEAEEEDSGEDLLNAPSPKFGTLRNAAPIDDLFADANAPPSDEVDPFDITLDNPSDNGMITFDS